MTRTRMGWMFVALMGSAICVGATPLQASFSSCLGSYNAAPDSETMVVSEVWANYVDGTQAAEQGLIGGGNDVLRVDLVGTVGSEIMGYDNDTNKLATLFTDTSAAHISVYESATWLCNSLFPSTLPEPYYPFNTTYCPLPAGDFALNISIPLYRSYALTTLRTQVRVVDTSLSARTLACYNIDFTPYEHDGWYYRLFLYLPIAIAIGFWTVTWAARFATGWIVGSGVAEYEQKEGHVAGGHGAFRRGVGRGAAGGVQTAAGKREARMRKWGTMIISGLSGERLSVSSALLRFVTPGLRDIIHYLQFCTVLGMLAVNWPSFAYPILAQGAWADLVWNVTLVQGSDAMSKRFDEYPSNYTAPAAFEPMMSDPYYPLYLADDTFNPLLDLHATQDGMDSWAAAVGLRSRDAFGTCLVIFLAITLGVTLISIALWALHGLLEYLSTEVRRTAPNNRSSWHSSPQASVGGKEAYEPRSYGWDSEGPQLPTQATLAAAQRHSDRGSAPSRFRRTWFRFRPKGEAGAFHAAALYGNLIRLILMFHLPITAFSVYQLSHSSASIVSKVFAALAFVFISVLIPAFIMFKIKRAPTGKLYDATRTLLSLGPMYNVYIEDKQMFRLFPLGASLIEGIVIGGGQKSGIAQAIIFVLVELVMLIMPAIWYPWAEGAGMGAPSAFLGIVRTACAVLVMLLSHTLAMTGSTRDWIAYAILLLHAIVFVFFILMLLVKLVEGLIRLFGGAHFDESTSPLDSGLFAAIMDLDCLNGVRGGKAAQRKRRKRGSRQLQRNVSAAGSLTTQMMLDRHSEGVPRQTPAEGKTPFLTPFGSVEDATPQVSYFPGYQPPLGPPPLERHSSDSNDPSAHGHIMDAWRPSQPMAYAPPGAYVPSATSPTGENASGAGPSRSFSVVRGGRADYQNPYDVRDPTNAPPRALSPPPMRIASPSKPSHQRQHSSSAIVERFDASGPPSPALNAMPALYPPGRDGPRSNNQGLRPPLLAIPKRRSLNNLKDDHSPDSQYSSSTPRGRKAKPKRKSKSGGWFGKADDSESSAAEEESDDEPGPSCRRPRAIPKPFEPAPSPLGEEKKGWKLALGLGRGKSREAVDDVSEMARDENKARKAALAAASGSMFAGVDAPPTPSRGFVVHRKGTSGASPLASPGGDDTGGREAPRSFKVKRMGQTTPTRAGGAMQIPTSVPLAPPAGGSTPPPRREESQWPMTERSRSGNSMEMARAVKGKNPLKGMKMMSTAPAAETLQAQQQVPAAQQPTRSFKVLGRPVGGSSQPATPTGPSSASTSTSGTGSGLGAFTSSNPNSAEPTEKRGSFVVNRPKSYQASPAIVAAKSSTAIPMSMSTSNSSAFAAQQEREMDVGVDFSQPGYPPTSFVPFDNPGSGSGSGVPARPVKDARRSEEYARGY